MLQVRRCFWGLSLKTGSTIIGIVSAACALAALACWEALAWAWPGRSWAEGQRWAQSARALGLPDAFIASSLRDSFSAFSFLSPGFRVLLHLLSAVEAFHVHFSLLLVYGVWKGRASWVRLWVHTAAAAMALRVLLMLPISVMMLRAEFVGLGASALTLTAAAIVLVAYFIIVVDSYYKQLMSEKVLKSFDNEWPDMK